MAGIERSGKDIITEGNMFRDATRISSEKLIKCNEIGNGKSDGWFLGSVEVQEHKRSLG
jgi:hypothetical protein